VDAERDDPVFGINKLDNLSLGTMEPGLMGILYGPVGLGKTTIGSHFLFKGASQGSNVCLLTTEPPSWMVRRFIRFKDYDSSWVKDGYISVFKVSNLFRHIGVDPSRPGREGLVLFSHLLSQMMDTMDLRRIVVDPAGPLFMTSLAHCPDLLESIRTALVRTGASAIFVLDTGLDDGGTFDVPTPHLFDIMIKFQRESVQNSQMNMVTIQRWKGSPHSRMSYVLDISDEGVMLIPRLDPWEVR